MKIVLHVLLLCCSFPCFSQQVYWVSFTQKDTAFSVERPQEFLSEKAIARRLKYAIAIDVSDLPVSRGFIDRIEAKGYTVVTKSKWHNAAAVKVPRLSDADSLRRLPFVKQVLYLGEHRPIKSSRESAVDLNEMLTVLESRFDDPDKKQQSDSVFYGKTFGQVSMLNVQKLHRLGYRGNNINIAVIDAGFNSVPKLPVFKHLIDSHRIKSTVDFVQGNDEVYEDDDHGMAVLSCMAGFIPYQFVGTAPFANYYLLRSEYSTTEMPIEETYWMEAAEYADSCGADLINSSLGYNEFDMASLSHTHRDLNGKTAIISRGAAMAVNKGIIVLNSAGNEGDDEWHTISVPADAAGVITVGGVDAKRNYASFSSVGPTSDKRVKPDVMAQGDNTWVASSRGVFYQGDGTSYACPVMTGAVACLLQANYSRSPAQILDVLHKSSDRYDAPDKYYGYGVPDLYLAHLMLTNDFSLDDTLQDTLLDCRVLPDKRIHITYGIPIGQKIAVTVQNAQDEMLFTETVSLKKEGIHRFALKKAKKLTEGSYTVRVVSEDKTSTRSFKYK